MFRNHHSIALVASAMAWGLCACGGNGSDNSTDPNAITAADIVNTDDLTADDADATAAGFAIGDVPDLLVETRNQVRMSTAHIKAVLARVKETVNGADPDKQVEIRGKQVGMWEQTTTEGVALRLIAARMTDTRVRYLLLGKSSPDATDPWKPLMTGIFVKKAEGKGGGRLHINLGNVSDLFTAPERDGIIHMSFANNGADVARRAVYRNVTNRADASAQAWNFGVDYIRKPGVGGRARTVLIGDLLPARAGTELFGARAAWAHGKGGRADAVVAALDTATAPPTVTVLGHRSQCWDTNGKLTAARDVITGVADAPVGDIALPGSCGGFAEDTDVTAIGAGGSGAAAGIADTSAADADPELDALLAAADADAITEVEADVQTDVAADL